MHGRKMGTHGGGARKKRKGSGHRGGIGMSGSGKRADHKKTLVNKKHGHSYFGKKGVTSRKTQRDTRKRINLRDIETHKEKYHQRADKKRREPDPRGGYRCRDVFYNGTSRRNKGDAGRNY